MADGVWLLTLDEVAAMRARLELTDRNEPWVRLSPEAFERIVATLEHLQAEWRRLVGENQEQQKCLEALEAEEDRTGLLARIEALEKAYDEEQEARFQALEDRDTWRSEAQDRRAEVERLQIERDRLLVANGALVRAAQKPSKIKLLKRDGGGGTGLRSEAVGAD
jgi:chromosome segregation ATPase